MTQPTSNPHQSSNRLIQRIESHPTLAVLFSAVLSSAATLGAVFLSRPGPPSEDPPNLRIEKVEWNKADPGQFSVSGTVKRLAGDQLLWSFVQYVTSDENQDVVYPLAGPCFVDSDRFACNTGYADGGEEGGQDDAGRKVKIWVAAVEKKQAAKLAEMNAHKTGPISSPDAIVHIPGESTIDSIDSAHP